MKKPILTVIICLITSFTIFAQKLPDVKFNSVPSTIEEFIQLRDEVAKTPEGGAAMFILALKIYSDNPDLGANCLIVSVDKNTLREDDKGYKGWTLLKQDWDLIKKQLSYNNLIPNSYIKGSSPENDYNISLPYIMEFSYNSYCGDPQSGRFKVFVKCSGADSSRPISIIKNDKGIWKATAWSSMVLGIKKKKSELKDDL